MKAWDPDKTARLSIPNEDTTDIRRRWIGNFPSLVGRFLSLFGSAARLGIIRIPTIPRLHQRHVTSQLKPKTAMTHRFAKASEVNGTAPTPVDPTYYYY